MNHGREDPRVEKALQELEKVKAQVAKEDAARWEREREESNIKEMEQKRAMVRGEFRRRATRLISEAISDSPTPEGVNPFAEFEQVVREVLKKAKKEASPEVITAIVISTRMMDIVAGRYASGYPGDYEP